MEKIECKKVSISTRQLLDCDNGVWRGGKHVIETAATPLANQPSPYIKGTYDENKIGAVKKIAIKSVHNGKDIVVFLEWESPTPNMKIEDINTFPDGVALLFPSRILTRHR
ncbi:MAG: hypothetical protein DRI57_28175 [Deltaproteobacteria bacterium]|nr:MAG: hypothetical protein DRI57_28175 [Deltaproteobacteria bacterium]